MDPADVKKWMPEYIWDNAGIPHKLFILVLDEGMWSASCLGCFTSVKGASSTH